MAAQRGLGVAVLAVLPDVRRPGLSLGEVGQPRRSQFPCYGPIPLLCEKCGDLVVERKSRVIARLRRDGSYQLQLPAKSCRLQVRVERIALQGLGIAAGRGGGGRGYGGHGGNEGFAHLLRGVVVRARG